MSNANARLLLGDEALAQGALDAGISGCYAYPGTPSTEIMEYIQAAPETAQRKLHAQWSANEKTAMEAALGMSYAGRRALVCMKHVGLNVAADGFINAAITGVGGGLVVVVADDPSMHSSQNEQDSRFYAKFAHVPSFEPASQQEAYDAMVSALALSEDLQVPVLIRITTRLAHSRANVVTGALTPQNPVRLPARPERFVLLPAHARANYAALIEKQPDMQRRAEDSRFNTLFDGRDHSLGIIASGIAVNYVRENYPQGVVPYPLLKIGQYPLPRRLIQRLMDTCKRILVVEEGEPLIEEAIHGLLGLGDKVSGRLDGALPRTGELNPERLAKALGLPVRGLRQSTHPLPNRPPRLCDGCPHTDTYKALLEALKDVGPGHVFSDIGCYTLGALPPLKAISSCVDMGASISMAKGAADAGLLPAVAVIGDSTFTHSGMTPLLDAVWEGSPITVIILDNSTTGMTGGQESPATGRLESIVAGLGVAKEQLRVITPLPRNHADNVAIMREEIFNHSGVSVIIARRDCVQTFRAKKPATVAN